MLKKVARIEITVITTLVIFMPPHVRNHWNNFLRTHHKFMSTVSIVLVYISTKCKQSKLQHAQGSPCRYAQLMEKHQKQFVIRLANAICHKSCPWWQTTVPGAPDTNGHSNTLGGNKLDKHSLKYAAKHLRADEDKEAILLQVSRLANWPTDWPHTNRKFPPTIWPLTNGIKMTDAFCLYLWSVSIFSPLFRGHMHQSLRRN